MSRHLAAEPQNTEALKNYRIQYQKKSRDNARTPVQWTSGPNAGFTDDPSVKPWMSVNANYKQINAEAQVADPNSVFNYWGSVLSTRKKYLDIFVYGDFVMVDGASEQVWAYARRYENQHALVLCNFTDQPIQWDRAANGVGTVQEVLLNNYGVSDKFQGGAETWALRPYEAVVLLVSEVTRITG